MHVLGQDRSDLADELRSLGQQEAVTSLASAAVG